MLIIGDTSDRSAMSRRRRPCDACRRRKSRCVVKKGSKVCVLCRFHEQSCTYEEPLIRRRQSLVAASREEGAQPIEPARHLWLHNQLGGAAPGKQASSDPSFMSDTLGLQQCHHAVYCGPRTVSLLPLTVPRLDEYNHFSGSHARKEVTTRIVHPDHAFRIILDDLACSKSDRESSLDRIEILVSGHGPKLVQLFFGMIHPNFPVLHRRLLQEQYAHSYREIDPSLLATVYLSAVRYWNFDEELASFTKPETKLLEDLAYDSFQTSMQTPKLFTAQAALVLAQYQSAASDGELDARYAQLTTQLATVVYSLGLHIDCSEWTIPRWEIALRRRVGWAIFTQDRWSSILGARPSIISREDWGLLPLSSGDFLHDGEDIQPHGLKITDGDAVFMGMASLSWILSQFYTCVLSAQSRLIIENAADRLGTLLSCTCKSG